MAREYINGEPVLTSEDELAVGDRVRYVRGGKLKGESRAWGDEEGLQIGQEYRVEKTSSCGNGIKVGVAPDWWIRKSHFTLVTSASLRPETSANVRNIAQIACPHCREKVSVAVNHDSSVRVIASPGSFSHKDWEGITLADLRKLPRLPAGQQYAIVRNNPADPGGWPHFVSEMWDMIGKVIVVSKIGHEPSYGNYYLGELPDSGIKEQYWHWWRPEWLVLLGDIESWYEFEVPDEPRRVRRITLKPENT